MFVLECFDTYKDDCPRWASQGECTNNPSWMTAFCKKSCWGCGLESKLKESNQVLKMADNGLVPVWTTQVF